MRHKRTINLYDEDDAHRDLLIYLEGISGDARQKQALVQMCLIGHRVMAYQESGEQAYFSVRNPDALKLSTGKKRGQPRLPSSTGSAPRTYDAEGVEEGSVKAPVEPPPVSLPAASTPRAPEAPPVFLEGEEEPARTGGSGQEQITKNDAVEQSPHDESQFDLDEEFNTLKILQQMGSR